MSKEEDILTFVLDRLKNFRELVSNTKNIEEALEDFKLGKADDAVEIIDCAKKLVEDIYTCSCEFKKEFNEKVNYNGKSGTHTENQSTKNIEYDKSKQNDDDEVEKVTNKEQKGKSKGIRVRISNRNKVENISDKLNSESELDTDRESDNDANSKNKINGNADVEKATVKEKKEKLDNSTSSDIVDTSLLENDQENKNNSKEQNKENIDVPNEVPKIRLVALSKLIDPQRKKSVKFDSSVIILTSSDEENTTPKKIMNDRENGVLKSALKKKFPVEKFENLLEPKTNKQSSPKKKSSKRNRDKDSSSDNSDSEKETDRKKIKLKIKLNPLSSVSNNEISVSDHTDSEDNDTENRSRKSSRLKNKAKETEKFREKLSKKFEKTRLAISRNRRKKSKVDIERLSDTSSLSDDSDYEEKSRNSKKDKKKKPLGDNSSDERINKSTKKIQKKPQKTILEMIPMDVDDDKFKYEVYVPLPRFQCNQLKDIYLHNKEILEIKILTNLKSLKKQSKKKQKSNDESEPENKDSTEELLKKSQTNKPESNKLSNKEQENNANDEASADEEVSNKNDESSNKEKIDEEKSKSDDSDKEIISNKESADKMSDDASASDKEPLSEPEELIPEPTNSEIQEKDPLTADDFMAEIAMNDLETNEQDDSDSEINNSDEENKKTEKNKDASINKDKNKENENNKEDEQDKNTDPDQSENSDSDKAEENSKKCMDETVDIQDKDKDKEDEDEDEPEKENKELSDKEDNSEKETDNESTKSKADDKKSDGEDKVEETDKKKEWRKNKLLTEKLDSSDSEENFGKFCKKKEKTGEAVSDSKKKTEILAKRKLKRSKIVISDSDESIDQQESSSEEEKSDQKSSSSNSESEKDEKDVKKKPARKRIKRVRDSSSSEEDKSTRKHIRRVLDRDSLSETTKKAEAEEKERKARIAEKQKKYNNIFEEKLDATIDKIVLEYDDKDDKKEALSIDKKLVEKLKPHQANGIRFMWDACFENLKRATKEQGSGCILAHCMGLGKTLQVIALIHALLNNSKRTGVEKVLVVCPVNTVLNWKAEFKKWLPKKNKMEVYELVSSKQNYEKQYTVNEWHLDGGVLIIGYTMFRNLSSPDNKRLSKKMREVFASGFVDPGPDLVICDEGHLLKNEKTYLSIAMNRIKTARRIVLTGTPLQNNLKEYWCMVQFIKPNLLGTYKEYLNRFVNPITNGQYTDSTQHDIMLMRKRSHVLHKLLDGVVQRRDYSVLEPYLPPKYEYVLFVKLSPTQVKLYSYYMEKYARRGDGSNRTSFLFTDFQQLQRICTHPRVLGDKSSEKREKLNDDDDEEDSEGSLKDFIDDGEESSAASSSSSGSGSEDSNKSVSSVKAKKKKAPARTRLTRAQAAQRRENDEESDPELVEVQKKWWQEFCDGEELDNINNSGKLSLLFQILKECEEIGDKVLIFSQSLLTLNCIEHFLEKIDEATQNGNTEKVGGYKGSWAIGLDYFRLDGSSSCDNRATWCDLFNNQDNTRARLFLISTKAGGLGINLVAANRVIIFDVSWNPSHDIQSIYRVYRFGQTKPCYIYRFVTYGAMEMKIYERQVTKQAISKRVIDEQQIDRHYNQNDLQELYKCDLEPEERPIPLVPKDILLGEMLQKYSDVIFKYHIHQSLLENKEAEGLNEEERKAAWEEFENEKVLRKTYTNTFNQFGQFSGITQHAGINPQLIAGALKNIVRHDNPTWSEVQINGIIPALVQQLQTQLAENDTSMYTRVTQEIQKMQLERMKEIYFQKQIQAMQARQQTMWNSGAADKYYIDPAQVRNMVYGNNVGVQSNRVINQAGPSVARNLPASTEVIDLND